MKIGKKLMSKKKLIDKNFSDTKYDAKQDENKERELKILTPKKKCFKDYQ